jgi:hypothetical protein
MRYWSVVYAMMTVACMAQSSTKVNLADQSTNPDFSAMPHTRPMTVGSMLPATCQTGEQFYNSAAVAGQNLYACTVANTWSLEGVGAGGSATGSVIRTALSITDSGSANAYAGCDVNATAPTDGLLVVLKPANDNTGSSTYNHCSAGPKPIQTAYGAAMLAGSIRADGAASPSGVILRYSSAASGGNGAWQNLTPGQVQLAPEVKASYSSFPRADGNGLTQWAQPTNPGDGRRTSLVECNGRSWDLTNTALLGALFTFGSGAGGVTGSASTGAGTQLPGCTLTTGAATGNNVYYNLFGDDKIFQTGRNLHFDVTVALSATTSTRNWIGLTGAAASTIAGAATPPAGGFLGFRYDTGAGDSGWQCVVASTSASVVNSSVIPSANQVHLKFIADDTNNAVHFYIDGAEVCTGTSVANYPPATFLSFAVTATTLTNAARGLTMAYQWIQGDK